MGVFRVLTLGTLFWIIMIGVLFIQNTARANTCPFQTDIANNAGNSGTMCAINTDYQNTTSRQYHSDYPVNLLSGNKHLTEADIYPQNLNQQINLEFVRYYNSMSGHKGILGYGWRTIYEPQLLDRGSTLSLIQPDGTQFNFYLSTDTKNGYKTDRYIANNPEYGYFIKEFKDGLMQWQWYRPSGQRFSFIVDSRYMTDKETLGKLHKITANYREPNSDYIQVIYDKNHRIAQVVDSLGKKFIFNYQDKQVLLHFGDATYIYYQDDKHNLIGYKNSEGDVFNYHYNNPKLPHSLTQKTLTSNHQTQIVGSWQYDDKGRVDYEELPHKKKSLTITYDPNAPTTKQDIIHEDGTKRYTTTTVNGLGETTEYIFTITRGFYRLIDKKYKHCQHCQGLSVDKTDDQGNVIQKQIGDVTYFYTYDDKSRLVLIEVQDNNTPRQWQQKRLYDGDSRMPSQIIRPSTTANKEHTLSITYNDYGQPVRIKEVGYRDDDTGIREMVRYFRYDYQLMGGKSKLISFDGALKGEKDKIYYRYDNKGQLVSIDYPENISQKIQYDDIGRVIHFTDVGGVIYQYQYDKQGNIIKSSEADKVRHIQYNAFGKPTKITDNSGQTLIYHYDESGALIGLSDGKSSKIELIRDAENRLVEAWLIDMKTSHKIHIDKPNELMAMAEFGEWVQEPIPNKAYLAWQNGFADFNHWLTNSAVQTLRDKDGKATTAYFDDFGRMFLEDSPSTGKTRYNWDLVGNLSQVINHQGQVVKFNRDGLGNIIEIQDNKETSIEFDKTNPKIVTNKDYQLSFDYNDKNQMVKKSYILDGHKFNVLYHYDDKGKLNGVTYPSGMKLGYKYDNDGKLSHIYKNSLIANKTLVYDFNEAIKDDQVYEQSFVFGNNIKQVQSYNKLGLPVMVGSQITAYSQAVLYKNGHIINYDCTNDVNGLTNDEKSSQPDTPATYLAQSTTLNDEYDALGRLTTQNDHRYEYDSQGRLVKVFKSQELITSYDYLYTGERYKKVTYQNSKPTHVTYYLYDNGVLLAEIYQDSHHKWHYEEYLHLGVRPAIKFENKTPYYLTTDHRGAVMVATDGRKNIVWQANLTDNGYAHIMKQDITVNLRGSNQYYDKDSDLHYNIHRYFDPHRNQYLTPDPLGLTVGDDLYAFAHNRPHEYVDLWGLAPEFFESWFSDEPYMERAILGILVHKNLEVAAKAFGYGANDGNNGTFGNLRPDVYYKNSQTIWELKPFSWQNNSYNYGQGLKQVQSYLEAAKNKKKECWRAGSYDEISHIVNSSAMLKTINLGTNIYTISIVGDKHSTMGPMFSGLIFYKDTKTKNPKMKFQELKESVPEPKLTEEQNKELKNRIDDMADLFLREDNSKDDTNNLIIVVVAMIVSLLGTLAFSTMMSLLSFVTMYAKASLKMIGKSNLIQALKTTFAFNINESSIKKYANEQFNKSKHWIKRFLK